MGARAKKRRRSDGSVALGKAKHQAPRAVPAVDPLDIGRALSEFRSAVARVGDEAAYLEVQTALIERLGSDAGGAVMWRASLLSDLLDWPRFSEKYENDSPLPSARMLEAAAIIRTFRDEKRFDWEIFEAMMDHPVIKAHHAS